MTHRPSAAFRLGIALPVFLCLSSSLPGLCPIYGQGGTATGSHPFGVQDMVRMERLGDAVVSPDRKQAVFTVRKWDPETNQATTNLWHLSLPGGAARRLTDATGQAEVSPVWSPDGTTVAFVTGRSGTRQIWTVAAAGGEPKQLTSFPIDVDNLRWSPDGQHIAFSAEVYPELGMAETAARDAEKAKDPVKAMKFDRLMIRHWDAWFDGKRNHLFVVPVKSTSGGGWEVAGPARDLMPGVDGDCPVKPFGGADEFAWSPDGQELAYTTQLGTDAAWSTDLNLFVVSVRGGPAKGITTDNQATDTGPIYSPDGATIAYRAMARPGFESDRLRVKLYDRASGKTRTLTEAWDRSPSSLSWTPDGRSLLATASEAARQKIFAIDARTGSVRPLIEGHYNTGVTCLSASLDEPGATLLFGQDSLNSPLELHSAGVDGKKIQRLTHFNDERMKQVQTSTPAEFHFPGALGEQVQAWLLKPVGFQPGKKYPVAMVIHGGPQGAIEDHFHYRWNPQAFAGAGYAVLAINFHGSTGFGQAFTDSISGDWGGKPFQDLMLGLDYALSHYDWLDEKRVGALGASYGGWMINWINGHTDRFRCLVNHDGGFDEYANYFTTEELWFPEWEFRGVPWEKPELFDKFSPSRYVANWKTPTLVIHGARDYRLIDAEGIATFTALQRRGIPSQFLYFPDENHWVLKPKNSIVWHETILAWLEKWLRE